MKQIIGEYFAEIIKLGSASSSSLSSLWPHREAQWLVVYAWNHGVQQYRLRQLDAARSTFWHALELHRIFLPNESAHYASLKAVFDYVVSKQLVNNQ
jgi:hypothetical protein